MLQIADRLGAQVQGDDGEPYTSAEDLPEHATKESPVSGTGDNSQNYLHRETRWDWIIYAAVILAVLAVNLLDLW